VVQGCKVHLLRACVHAYVCVCVRVRVYMCVSTPMLKNGRTGVHTQWKGVRPPT